METELFEPLTFEEFVFVFDLSGEDIEAINNNKLLRQQIDSAIYYVNKSDPLLFWRTYYRIEDERLNSGFYHLFIKQCLHPALAQIHLEDAKYLFTRIDNAHTRLMKLHGGPCFRNFIGHPEKIS